MKRNKDSYTTFFFKKTCLSLPLKWIWGIPAITEQKYYWRLCCTPMQISGFFNNIYRDIKNRWWTFRDSWFLSSWIFRNFLLFDAYDITFRMLALWPNYKFYFIESPPHHQPRPWLILYLFFCFVRNWKFSLISFYSSLYKPEDPGSTSDV